MMRMDLSTPELGRRLVAARVLAGLSQENVRRLALEDGIAGLSPTATSEMENGKREPNLRTLRWLCKVYAVDMATLTDPRYRAFQDDSKLRGQVDALSAAVRDLTAKVG